MTYFNIHPYSFVKRLTMKKIIAILFLFSSFSAAAQLNIVNGESTPSGSGWSISGNVLTVTGNVSIDADVITQHLTNTGDLEVNVTSPAAAVTISEAITYAGATTRALTIRAGAGLSVNADMTMKGSLTLVGTTIAMGTTGGTDLISSTNGQISLLATQHITNTTATTITTQGGNVLLASNTDDATDADASTNGCIRLVNGLTITTNGGNITLGGGDATASGYAVGSSAADFYTGIRIDVVASLNSGGGDIVLRGKSYAIGTANTAFGVGFWSVSGGTTINSGTGTVTIDGFSNSWGGSYNAGFYALNPVTVTSANTTGNAIQLIGKATVNDGQAWGLETDDALSLIATADGGGITISTSQQRSGDNYDAVFRGETNILAKSGPIQLLGGQSGGIANGRFFTGSGIVSIGSKASSAVPVSSSNILIQYDMHYFTTVPRMATSGTVTWRPTSTSFGQSVSTSWYMWNQNGQTMSGLVIGKPGNLQNVTHETNAITVAGSVSLYGATVGIDANLTSTADGDLLFRGDWGGSYDAYIGAGYTVSKTGGTGTLTLKGDGGVGVWGTITASGTGVLNTVLWSDVDNTNDGGVRVNGTITTNGGDVWLGGSSTTGGSSTWNGLTVGDGPSVGAASANVYAIDFFNNITTNGGDVFIWAGDGASGNYGIITDGDGAVISTGSGNVTFIADRVWGSASASITLNSTGVFTFTPHGGSWPGTFTWTHGGGTNINLGDYLEFLVINNFSSLGGLVLGQYDGMSGVTLNNTSAITISSSVTTAGPFTLFGGTTTLGADITTTVGDLSIYTDNSLVLSGTRTVTAAGAFKYMPAGTSFAAPVSYPLNANLNVVASGLQLGKSGNTAGITIAAATSSTGPVTVYSGDFTTNAGATLTSTAGALEVNASGNVTLNAALSGTTTTINGQGNVKTLGSLTNLNLSGGSAQSITGTANLSNLTLNKSAGTATISAGPQNLTGVLTLTGGTLAAGGNLVMKSSASGTARVAQHGPSTGNVTGNVVVERWINSASGTRSRQWRLLGFPYNAAMSLSAIGGMSIDFTTNLSMMYFNETGANGATGNTGPRNSGYVSYTSSGQQVAVGQGVAAWLYGNSGGIASAGTLASDLTITSSGALNEDGNDVTIPLSYTSTLGNPGWNLVSNPFASSIAWSGVTRTANVEPTIYRWNPATANWTTRNTQTSISTGGADDIIESGSGFFVRASASGQSITIPQSAKTTSATVLPHFGRAPFRLDVTTERVPSGKPKLAGLRLKVSGQGNPLPDDIYIDMSREDATPGYDHMYDAESMGRTSGAGLSVKERDGRPCAVQFDVQIREAGKEQRYYPLTVTSPAVGQTLLEIGSEGDWNPMNTVSLIDTKEGKTILMAGGTGSYTFNMTSKKEEGRFILAINHVLADKNTGIPGSQLRLLGNPVTGDRIDLLLAHPTARPLRWELRSIQGAKVAAGQFSLSDGNIQYGLKVPGMRASGLYVLRVELDNGEVQTIKVMRQ
jgi:cytoskeletal protein CcmA (bactofilin family)